MLPAEGASPPEVFRRLLERRARAFGLTLAETPLQRLSGFLARLDVARRQTNLTGPLTAEKLVDHALESTLGQGLIPQGARVIDIGSGAGLPGLALAAARPDLWVIPVEPRRKRFEFLRQAGAELENVAPETSLARLPARGADVATARAVGSVDRILGEGLFLKGDGLFLAWTSDVEKLGRLLAPHFLLEDRIAVPQSHSKAIAAFRKRSVPQGTRD